MRAVIVSLVILAMPALAAEDERLTNASIIYARGTAIYKADARGKGEVELAQLPAKGTSAVRAMRTDSTGSVLLVDIGGKWSWMPLDGSAKALTELPCADGPAQLAVDGLCVLCRSVQSPTKSIIVNLATAKITPMDVPPPGARIVGAPAGPGAVATRKLVWADATGVWAAPITNLRKKAKVAPDAPLRGFLPSPDGSRAVGVYTDVIHDTPKTTKPADMLMTFSLDGQGARRKTIKASIPVEWSLDNQWVLVQDGAAACVASAKGGQYKCWRGYTAASIAPDGSYVLLLGNRDRAAPKKEKSKSKKAPPKTGEAPTDEPELAGDPDHPIDDVAVPPPSGPLALYRGKLDGAHTEAPTLVVRVVEGSAVWIPKP